jgi:uncharacterized membrane protein required for colicin V production
MKLYLQLLFAFAMLSFISLVVIGSLNEINGMVVGGVIGLCISAVIGLGFVIHTGVKQKEPVQQIKMVNNPLYLV